MVFNNFLFITVIEDIHLGAMELLVRILQLQHFKAEKNLEITLLATEATFSIKSWAWVFFLSCCLRLYTFDLTLCLVHSRK